ncbi:MAG: hypothetical protein ABI583_10850 [Betaproteobacteria bacterium]
MSVSLAQTAEPEPITSPRLGVPEVLSPMGFPLWIRIPLVATDAAINAAESSFALGPRPINAGIPFIENAEISVERQGDKHFLVIRSRQSVNELAVGLVIREQLKRGVRSREFTVLLDPPVLFEALLATRAAEAAQKAESLAPKLPPQALVIEPTATPPVATTRASRPVRPAQSNSRPRRVAAVTAVKPSNTVVTSITPDRRVAQSERTTAASAIHSRPKKATPDKPLRLSLSVGDLSALPTANEATRNELRRRQLILDTDTLMSALLERNHKITLLEKELSALAARVMATERSLNIPAPSAASAAPTSIATALNPTVTSTSAATLLPSAPAPTATVPVAPPPQVTATVAPPKPPAGVTPQPTESVQPTLSWWSVALVTLGLLAFVVATLAIMRRRRNAREQAYAPEVAVEHMSGPLAEVPKRVMAPTISEFSEERIAVNAPALAPVAEISAATFPEIHFELPDTSNGTDVTDESALSTNAHTTVDGPADTTQQVPSQASNADAQPAPDDIRGRRTRYLQSRYQDIAILLPPLDAPQRLIKQAGRIHDEGAVDYAKRLLKFAAYSRPYAEEYWLALLELLYREKFANDYLVNAKWFRSYLPKSANWDEVQRIGYLLDPAAPLFASAAAWSHEEPILGTWLPASHETATQVSVRPGLKLELAN